MVKINIFRKIRPKFTIEGFRILSTDFDHILGKRPQEGNYSRENTN